MGIKISTQPYTKRITESVEDEFMREAVSAAQGRFRRGRQMQADKFGNWEEWRNLGEEIRKHTIENLDYYLNQLSDNASNVGVKVYFALTAENANDYIKNIIKQKNAKKIVKSKSMVTEEIGLNEILESIGTEVIETDLGEWVLQLDNDHPSHIVTPALHKNKKQIKDTFSNVKGYEDSDNPQELASFAREQLRREFLTADIGITGCNFAVAESGTVTLVTNEGNGRMITSLPDTLITVMGMERIVPTWEELDILTSLLTRAAVGQDLTSYITAITGTRLAGESDGPDEYHLVIVDNGRSQMLGTEFQSVLHCIRCAACINVCPVYRHIGGHAYGSIYPGPIGAVITPLLGGYEEHSELPYASTLCGACTEVCPVKIPLHEQLIMHRQNIVENNINIPTLEKIAMKGFSLWASRPFAYKASTIAAKPALKPFSRDELIRNGPGPLKNWTVSRDFPTPKDQTFRSWFKSRHGDGV